MGNVLLFILGAILMGGAVKLFAAKSLQQRQTESARDADRLAEEELARVIRESESSVPAKSLAQRQAESAMDAARRGDAEIARLIRETQPRSNNATSRPRRARRPAQARRSTAAPEPYLEEQNGMYCGKHTVNAILVATGICTRANVPDVREYQNVNSDNFSYQDLNTVLDRISTARNPQRPYAMNPITRETWGQISRSILPAAEAFVINTRTPHWYAIVSSRRPSGTRVWWNVDSVLAGVGNNGHPIRIGTDQDLARMLVTLMPSNLNGRVQGIPRGNHHILQVLAVRYNADKIRNTNSQFRRRQEEDARRVREVNGH